MNNNGSTPAALRADVAFNATVSWQVSMVLWVDATRQEKIMGDQVPRRRRKPAVTPRAYR